MKGLADGVGDRERSLRGYHQVCDCLRAADLRRKEIKQLDLVVVVPEKSFPVGRCLACL